MRAYRIEHRPSHNVRYRCCRIPETKEAHSGARLGLACRESPDYCTPVSTALPPNTYTNTRTGHSCETSVSLTGSDSSAVVLGFVSNARHGSSMTLLPLCLPRMQLHRMGSLSLVPRPVTQTGVNCARDRPNIHDTGP